MSLDISEAEFPNDYQNQEAPPLNVPLLLILAGTLVGLILVSHDRMQQECKNSKYKIQTE